MKTQTRILRMLFCLAAASLTPILQVHAAIFADHFNKKPSALWRNETGAWAVEAGAYKATNPANFPAASSSLPFNLTDFSVDFDVNDVQDGGIWLRSAAAPGTAVGRKGIIFNLQTINGTKVYWHIVEDGNEWGDAQNLVFLSFGNTVHVHIEVAGDTYSAFLDGSSTPASTLTTSLFTQGHVALYDFSGQSFDNFVLRAPSRRTGRPRPGF
jgi:hypothetical protein